jgi:hypothetical protein
MRRLVVFW